MKGLFITFEGPDGAGKTTQIKKLADQLQQDGYEVIVTREPGGTFISDQIRTILLSPENHGMTDRAEVLLYAASRAQHVQEKIIPALKNNQIVLCDRYIDASMAYQAFGLGIEENAILSINQFASSGLQPARTYMLDIPVEEGRRRLLNRVNTKPGEALDRIEQKELDYHKRVREGFQQIYQMNRQRVFLLDANRPENILAQEILDDCKRLLKKVSLN